MISRDFPDAIYKWYSNWLLAHGWRISEGVGATTWQSHKDFARGTRERFTVAVDDPSGLAGVLGTSVPKDRGTVFEVRYEILPAAS